MSRLDGADDAPPLRRLGQGPPGGDAGARRPAACQKGLPACTERTITTLEQLLEELARVRRRGFATAFAEWEPGQNGIAAPVHDARGRVVASVVIWGPAYRITPARIGELAAEARAAAGTISTRLGGAAAWPAATTA